MTAIRIELTSDDFKRVLGPREVAELANPEVKHLGPKKVRDVVAFIPAAIVAILEEASPKGFSVTSIEVAVELSGAPFGVGVSGTATVMFERGSGTSTPGSGTEV